MAGRTDPYTVLGVRPGADQAEIHKAYRAAVRRTHPDAGGTAAAFEAVQDAYETLRDPTPSETSHGGTPRPRARPDARRRPPNPDPSPTTPGGSSNSRMEALLAESKRLEDEARRLAGLPPRHGDGSASEPDTGDSVSAILRDASEQLRQAAESGARELRRRVRRML